MGSEIFPSFMFMVFALVMSSLSYARKVRRAPVQAIQFPQNPRRGYRVLFQRKPALAQA
jgi:hypothetical protein